jgi:3-dehydroquinate dehydratase-1
MPVILTVRHKSEGGKWNRPEGERLKLYAEAIKHLAAVDVEFKSSIAPAVAKLARLNRKVCILSHHNFKGMTPLNEIRSVVAGAGKIGSIVKIVTLIESRRSVSHLRDFVREGARVPLCVMGMGYWGESTRVSFPALGSCLTYGYLDVPAAPGQPFAPNLVKQLRQIIPQYDKEFTTRKLRLQVTESEMSLFL